MLFNTVKIEVGIWICFQALERATTSDSGSEMRACRLRLLCRLKPESYALLDLSPPLSLASASGALRHSSSALSRRISILERLSQTRSRARSGTYVPSRTLYMAPVQLASNTATRNLWKDYQLRHFLVAFAHGDPRSSVALLEPPSFPTSARSGLFIPRVSLRESSGHDFRNLLPHMIIDNNLPFRLVNQPSLLDLIEYLSPTTKVISWRTFVRYFKTEFKAHQNIIKE